MFATFVLATMLAAATPAAVQVSAPVTYDEFMQQSVQKRITTFNAISAENRAALVREQITRWGTKNAERLDTAQQQFLAEAVTLITPEKYDMAHPRRQALLQEMKAFEARVGTLFTVDDARQAFTIHGDYIPH
jgi:hypothetical protein